MIYGPTVETVSFRITRVLHSAVLSASLAIELASRETSASAAFDLIATKSQLSQRRTCAANARRLHRSGPAASPSAATAFSSAIWCYYAKSEIPIRH